MKNSWMPLEKNHFSKKYQERLIETKEAEKEIKEFLNEDCEDGSYPHRLDGVRPERS